MTNERILVGMAIAAAVVLFAAAPALIAFARHHPERVLIAKLSPGGLVSFILWGALMAWAVSDTRDDAVISKHVARLRERKLLPLIVAGLIALGLVVGAVTMMKL